MALTQFWKLDDNAANTTVVATTGTNAALGGGDNTSAKQTAGPGGDITWGFDLNGTDDYVDISGASIDNSGAFTLSFWIALDSTTNQYLFGRAASAFRYVLLNGTNIQVGTNEDGADFTIPSLSLGTWYHVFITRDGSSNCRLWIDGTESVSGTQTLTGFLTLDAIYRASTNFSNGKVSQVRYFNSDESANVATYYDEGVDEGGGGSILPLVAKDMAHMDDMKDMRG